MPATYSFNRRAKAALTTLVWAVTGKSQKGTIRDSFGTRMGRGSGPGSLPHERDPTTYTPGSYELFPAPQTASYVFFFLAPAPTSQNFPKLPTFSARHPPSSSILSPLPSPSPQHAPP